MKPLKSNTIICSHVYSYLNKPFYHTWNCLVRLVYYDGRLESSKLNLYKNICKATVIATIAMQVYWLATEHENV